jgi:hypothetical protein
MKELKEFVERENQWTSIWSGIPLDLRSAADRQAIADRIDSALSPENLHCDGEISSAEANRKYRFLTRAAEQLLKLDPTVRMYEVL